MVTGGGPAAPQPKGCTCGAQHGSSDDAEHVQLRTAQETHIIAFDVAVDELETVQVIQSAGHIVQHLHHDLPWHAPAATPHKLWADVGFKLSNSSGTATGTDEGGK